jgi:class III poly(R)-hydroxyalkanoic acid synthase PhaE subunit
MATDAWRQWAAFAALFNPTAGVSAPGAIPGPATGFAPFFDAERFAEAARAFQQSGQDSQAGAAAFSDFLRDQFGGVLEGMWGRSAPGRSTPSAPEAPALGPTREQQESWQRLAAAWQRLQEVQRRLQRLWSDALGEAARAFVSRRDATIAPLTPEAMHRLYDAWVDCAEEAYARMVHAENYGTALAESVKAASEWRDESAALIESWAKWLDWPTRSEINSLSLRVRTLEEQQRAMNRAREAPARATAKKRTAAVKKSRGKRKR